MLIFDQLKKSDPRLRLVAGGVFGAMLLLLAGLWYHQIVSARHYRESLRTQSFRTVRVPAVRGEILDRNGTPLAENRPSYQVSLYLDELREEFQARYKQLRPPGRLKGSQIESIGRQARYEVVNRIVQDVGALFRLPLQLDAERFHEHYQTRLALPLTIATHLDHRQIALFEERSPAAPGLNLDTTPVRHYPHAAATGHLLGYLKRDNSSAVDEEAFFNYRLPDFRGAVGIEGAFDEVLRGRAGMRSLLVNNLGYRQTDQMWTQAEPGRNVVLTIDLPLQLATDLALRRSLPGVRGAAIVMDARTGDILALVSAPSYDPNDFVPHITGGDWFELTNSPARPLANRATKEIYPPGSVFKIVSGLAALESGVDPDVAYRVEPHPTDPGRGAYFIGRRPIKDQVSPGHYNFRRALVKSSNSYFIHHGLAAGIDRIRDIAAQFHLGERTGIPLMQESPGIFPTREWVLRTRGGWSPGDTANVSIGQGDVTLTPLQVTVMIAAIANGGSVLWPRLVDRIESQDPRDSSPPQTFPAGRVRNQLNVSARSLQIVRDAMLADVEDGGEGTGRAAAVPGMRIGGKTGTAQITEGNREVDKITWFASFGDHAGRLYSVTVMVESGQSGGTTCAPIARKIYEAIQRRTNAPVKPPQLVGGGL
jgi:penicillin-binding protein 2